MVIRSNTVVSPVIIWVESERLVRSWHPGYFSPEYNELDKLLRDRTSDYVPLGHLTRPFRSATCELGKTKADWLLRIRQGTMIAEPCSQISPNEKVQDVPNGSLVLSLTIGECLPSLYWDEKISSGKGVTSVRNLVLVPASDKPIAWLAAELTSWECLSQVRRATTGSLTGQIEPEVLLDIRVRRPLDDYLSSPTQNVALAKLGVVSSAQKYGMVEAERSRLRPFVLTGATFEDRMRQFESHLLERRITEKHEVFFVEASTRDRTSDLFVVRPIGETSEKILEPTNTWLKPQEDIDDINAWRQWYWNDSPEGRIEIFNTLQSDGALPTYLLLRTIADPRSLRPPFSGSRVLPAFHNVQAAIQQHLHIEGLDLEEVTADISDLWLRHNNVQDDPDELVAWLRTIYRPVAAIKAFRGDNVAGAYLVFGQDQLVHPERARVELEAVACSASDILRKPSEIIDDAARSESIRRLSWMMHQIAGPLLRIDGVLSDLLVFLDERPQLASELIPSLEVARRQAAMNNRPLDCYSLRERLKAMLESLESIRHLQSQIRSLKNAQKDPERSLVNVGKLLLEVAEDRGHCIQGLTIDIQCPEALVVPLDKFSIEAALGEVVGNAIRELCVRSVGSPRITLSAKTISSNLFIEVTDNALPVNSELIENAFEEDATTYARVGKGTGLGLTIVKEIVHKHLGRCFLQANTNAAGGRQPGVTFRAELPIMGEDRIQEPNRV